MIDREQIYKWWSIFHEDDSITEIRSFGKSNFSGYYKNIDNAIRDIEYLEAMPDQQIYFIINPINEACYGREQQEKLVCKPKHATTDAEILGRKWIMLDFDPERVSGTNSTNEELEYAKQKARDVYKYLQDCGFNTPVVCLSGNGIHIMIPCRLSATTENDDLVLRFLKALSLMFSDDRCKVDVTCKNRARLSKVYGTTAKKGVNCADRPWRTSKFLSVPNEIVPVDVEYIKKIANLYPEDKPTPSVDNNWGGEKFNVEEFFNKHNIGYKKESYKEGTKYILEHCAFNPNHKGKDACVFQRDNGALSYTCLHASCSHHTWKEFRMLYEPDAYDKKERQIQYRPLDRTRFQQRKEFKPIEHDSEKGNLWLKMSDIKKPTIDINDYIPSGLEQIDKLMIGFKRKHVSLWSGYRGSAKSSVLNMFVLNAAQQGYKTALWTGELDGGEVKQWLYLQAAGKGYNRKSNFNDFYYTPNSVCEKIDQWIDKYLWLFNNEYGDNYKQLEHEIRKLKKEEDIDMVILDSLMILDYDDLEGDKNEKQKNLMRLVTKLAKELNIHIHIVAHPNKSGTFLRPNNISGSGNIPDLAQNIFIIHRQGRDFERNCEDFLSRETIDDIVRSGCTNCIEICKCRDKGTAVGKFVYLYFEIESNRLKNSIAEHTIYGWQEQAEQTTFPMPSSDGFAQPFTSSWEEPYSGWSGATIQEDDEYPF